MQTKLKPVLSFSDVFSYGLLYFVPMAPVAVFGLIYNISAGQVALTYLLAASAMLFSALSYSEMARKVPLSGSVYSYVSQGIGPLIGFLSGWMILLDYLLLPALLAILGAIALGALFPEVPRLAWILIFVIGPMLVNLFGIRINARLGKILLAIQLLVLAIFCAGALFVMIMQGVTSEALIAPFYNSEKFSISLAFAAVPIAALSFIGFDAISTLNEEAKGGGETVSKVTLLLLVAVTCLFVAQVYLAAVFVPIGTIYDPQAAEIAFYVIGEELIGRWFLPVLTLTGAIIAILANALVSQATSSKVVYAMARDERLPSILNMLNKYRAPQNALFAVAALSLIIASSAMDAVELLVTMVTFGALTAYIMLNIAVIFYFSRHGRCKLFHHILSPLCGSLILAYALINGEGEAKIIGGFWLLIGIAIALWLRTQKRLEMKSFEQS